MLCQDSAGLSISIDGCWLFILSHPLSIIFSVSLSSAERRFGVEIQEISSEYVAFETFVQGYSYQHHVLWKELDVIWTADGKVELWRNTMRTEKEREELKKREGWK